MQIETDNACNPLDLEHGSLVRKYSMRFEDEGKLSQKYLQVISMCPRKLPPLNLELRRHICKHRPTSPLTPPPPQFPPYLLLSTSPASVAQCVQDRSRHSKPQHHTYNIHQNHPPALQLLRPLAYLLHLLLITHPKDQFLHTSTQRRDILLHDLDVLGPAYMSTLEVLLNALHGGGELVQLLPGLLGLGLKVGYPSFLHCEAGVWVWRRGAGGADQGSLGMCAEG